ncbi:MAG: alpha-hydroxy-acid oxidizing protein [Rhizobiales bacterium]|nr:alpha-hydroxy-acid oxidizing protein [Hyphomicrobiales bacterium]MBI3673950.1 alpha-hydroxy-acid oxidizing protein [Hyphomicrobiales bacterium]
MVIASWEDARRLARRRLPKIFFDYIDGAAFSEQTARANVDDYDHWLLNQRVLAGHAQRDSSTAYLGKTRPLPFMLGPVGFSGLFAPQGEIQAARAAHAAGIPFCLSNFGITSLEDLRKATDGPIWFQLYVMRDRSLSELFMARAEAAGVEALCVTVDTSVGGVRDRDIRNGFRSASRLTPRIALGLLARPMWCLRIAAGGPLRIGNLRDQPQYGRRVLEQASKLTGELDPSTNWEDMKRIRQRWKGRLVIKGILAAEDALRCAELGADAIVVSNHGGRQLDCSPSTVSVLPEIVAAVGERLDVLIDGGVRRGSHVVKALALGARGVLLGRAYAYALGAAGEKGVTQLIEAIATEIDVCIGHMGLARADELYRRRSEVLRRHAAPGP